MKRKGSKIIISVFSPIRVWLEFLLSLSQIAAISIRVFYRDIVHITIVYLPFFHGAVSRGLASWGPRIK